LGVIHPGSGFRSWRSMVVKFACTSFVLRWSFGSFRRGGVVIFEDGNVLCPWVPQNLGCFDPYLLFPFIVILVKMVLGVSTLSHVLRSAHFRLRLRKGGSHSAIDHSSWTLRRIDLSLLRTGVVLLFDIGGWRWRVWLVEHLCDSTAGVFKGMVQKVPVCLITSWWSWIVAITPWRSQVFSLLLY
jgi:hypothetical protein